ncbi:hypothetical protein CMV_006191 [Castanea mollissima]|uniref:Transmembrane protein n=1 Tax=Castanea mollissima TaxID=60419 RepID=A0A8J4RP63_9ROSI|nr:hypothetical protein CMV_006191 [Castanea mollissima]
MKPLSLPLEPSPPGFSGLCCRSLIFVVSSSLFGFDFLGFDLYFFVGWIFVVHDFYVYLNSVVGVEVKVEMGLFDSLWVSGFAWGLLVVQFLPRIQGIETFLIIVLISTAIDIR